MNKLKHQFYERIKSKKIDKETLKEQVHNLLDSTYKPEKKQP